MSQAPVDRNDPRRRYTHQAFDVTYLGKAKETGPSGIGARLSATYQASILLTVDASPGQGTLDIGDLTQGIWSFQVVHHVALTGGTLNLTVDGTNILAGFDLSQAPGVYDLDAAIAAPLPQDEPLTAAVAGGTAGETAVLSLLVTPAENGWF